MKFHIKDNSLFSPFGFLKMVFLITCFIFFAIQARISFELYLEKATVMGTTYLESPNKPLPSVTLCPEDVLKVKGVPITRVEFGRMSYKMVRLNLLLFHNDHCIWLRIREFGFEPLQGLNPKFSGNVWPPVATKCTNYYSFTCYPSVHNLKLLPQFGSKRAEILHFVSGVHQQACEQRRQRPTLEKLSRLSF